MTNTRYNRTARVLHWTVAVLVFVQLILGVAADKASKPLSGQLLDQHVRLGLLILALIILRALWRASHSPPPLPVELPRWQRRLAGGAHRFLYVLLLVLPISGYVLWDWIGRPLDWYGLLDIPLLFKGGDDETWRSIAGYTHVWSAYALMALISIHIAAALWHEFVARDQLISKRML